MSQNHKSGANSKMGIYQNPNGQQSVSPRMHNHSSLQTLEPNNQQMVSGLGVPMIPLNKQNVNMSMVYNSGSGGLGPGNVASTISLNQQVQ